MNHNLEVLKESNPRLYEKVNQFDESYAQASIELLETEPGLDGDNVLYIEKEGIDYRLNSMYSPTHEAEVWGRQYALDNVTNTVIMFGLGNGYFIRELLKKLPETDKVVIFEPSYQIFFHVLENYNIEDILGNERVFIGIKEINDFDFHIYLKSHLEASNLHTQVVCSFPQYETIFQKEYKDFLTEVKGAMEFSQMNFNTYAHLSEASMQNTIKNVQKTDDYISICDFEKKYQFNAPVIIVAAGPSIEESIEELKKVKGKAYIIAVDRILDYLLDAGIVPDFVASMDSAKMVSHFTTRDYVEIPMFCILQSRYEIMQKQKGKKILCQVDSFIGKFLTQKRNKEIYDMQIGQSVACFAFQAAAYMGAKNIILVGQDLAFKGKVTHAGGEISNPGGSDTVMIEGVNGDMVASRYDWREYAIWFKEMIHENPDITVYDVKTQGAKIEGAISMGLMDAVKESTTEENHIDNMKEVLENVPLLFDQQDRSELIQYMDQTAAKLDKMKRKSKEGASLCYDVIQLIKDKKLNSSKVDGKLRKITEINELLEGSSAYSLLDRIIVKSIREDYLMVNSLSGEVEQDNLKVFGVQRSMFEATAEASDKVKKLIRETLGNM